MKQRFLDHIHSIASQPLRYCCEELYDNNPAFFTWPASLSYHHAYEGGLLAHTVEVCDYARHIAECMHGQESTDILIAAALWHDFCKVWEYEKLLALPDSPNIPKHALKVGSVDESGLQGYFIHTDYGKRIHHIAGSAIEFTATARKHGVNEDVIEQVQHCILAHHGRREWGSPVEPQTIEALILHQADMLSSRFGKTKDSHP